MGRGRAGQLSVSVPSVHMSPTGAQKSQHQHYADVPLTSPHAHIASLCAVRVHLW